MEHNCTEERLLNDVKNHSMEILRDDGDAARHISFTNNGSSIYRFDLITWPGHLCIAGDCGTYVFSRIRDMFEFFRMDDNDFNKRPDRRLNINPGYWGEKLQSIGTNAGYKEFDGDAFRDRVTYMFNTFWEDTENEEAKAECWEAIQDEVLSQVDNGEHFSYSAAHDFFYKTPDGISDFYFQDFFDGGGTECYSFQYIWCLYAIVYGISEYDKHKEAQPIKP